MRLLKILTELQTQNHYVNAAHLAKLFHVSSRTIMNDLKLLMQDGARNGFCIHLKRGEGYYLEVLQETKFQTYCDGLDESSAFVHSACRIEDIMAILLLQNDYLTQDSIADRFQVSKSIIKQDMHKVSQMLKQRCVLLDRKPHYGIKAIARSFHRNVILTQLYEKQNAIVVNRCKQSIGQEFKEIEKQLMHLLKEYHLDTNYTELYQIDTFIKVLICTHMRELFEEEPWETGDDTYYEIAMQIANQIQRVYHIQLISSELDDLAVFLKQKTKNMRKQDSHDEIANFVNATLLHLSKEYHMQFQKDETFTNNLIAHVTLLVDRLHQSISFTNPMLNEICIKYPVVFDIAIRFANLLEEHYYVQVNQDEIGFIATHFAAFMEKVNQKNMKLYQRIAVVCSSGGGSAFLIKLKLESMFPNSEVVTFSLLEKVELKAYVPDVIFTITELEDVYDVPIIKINEIMDDKDVLKIKHMIAKDRSDDDLLSILQQDFFQIIETKQDYEKLLETMAAKIEEYGYAKQGFREYVMQRENCMSTIYAQGVAIPHPINMCGEKNLISVAVVKSDIKHHGKKVNLIFMVSLRKEDLKLHEAITAALLDIMNDEKKVERLMHSVSFHDFVRRMHTIRKDRSV